MQEKVLTVSQVNAYISNLFQCNDVLSAVYMKGEISNCKYHSSGHIYFTLKDASAQIACVMFAGNAARLKIRLEEGLSVIAHGAVRVFERDGKYQLYVDSVRPDGIGALYEQYERLKRKLEQEGVFDPAHKKEIPFYCKKVGIVTAKTGAAVQDIMSISRRRNPYVQLYLYPAQVQGVGASESVIRGITLLQKEEVDVIIIGRGGGSLEDLWAFNDETLARVIYDCNIPIISAVGHETDFTIADYAADLRAPTPSAAAELAVCEIQAVLGKLIDMHSDLYHGMMLNIEKNRQKAERMNLKLRMNSPKSRLEQQRKLLERAQDMLPRLMKHRIDDKRHQLQLFINSMKGLSPLNKLQSGFSYVSDEYGNNIASIESVKAGTVINVAVTDGYIDAKVTGVRESDFVKAESDRVQIQEGYEKSDGKE